EGLEINNPTRAKQYRKIRVMQTALEFLLILNMPHEAASDPKNKANCMFKFIDYIHAALLA
ncbi:MAG: hypothetical protein ACEQSN_13425, partial [Yersinia sp. (in: enterobacteria)]